MLCLKLLRPLLLVIFVLSAILTVGHYVTILQRNMSPRAFIVLSAVLLIVAVGIDGASWKCPDLIMCMAGGSPGPGSLRCDKLCGMYRRVGMCYKNPEGCYQCRCIE